jgi:hypothetical protein
MTCCQGPHRARVFRLLDARTAGRRPLTAEAGGAVHSAILRWIVSRASGVDSEQARVVRISSTLSRDTIVHSSHAFSRKPHASVLDVQWGVKPPRAASIPWLSRLTTGRRTRTPPTRPSWLGARGPPVPSPGGTLNHSTGDSYIRWPRPTAVTCVRVLPVYQYCVGRFRSPRLTPAIMAASHASARSALLALFGRGRLLGR